MKTLLPLCLISFSVLADGYRGTGDNWGRGWQGDGNGGYQGAGGNWGRGHRYVQYGEHHSRDRTPHSMSASEVMIHGEWTKFDL